MIELGLGDFYSASSSSAASVQSSRVDMSEQQRKDCMNELLHKAEGDNLPTGTQAELAQKYGVSRWTIYRIWKSVKKSLEQRQQLRPSKNYKGNVGRKRIAVSEQDIMELPLRKRCNIRSLASALKLSSEGNTHDEIDFEFLGNVSGQPYTLHTNVFTQGKGGREQQFHLWFDPTLKFHTYSVIWNPQMIIFLVDNTPIRVFKNHEAREVPFPKTQPMKIYSSLWNADQWATQGGRVKTDWSKAPFTAYYRKFNVNPNHAAATAAFTDSKVQNQQQLNAWSRRRLRWVQKYFMIYNYCTDAQRFPRGVPSECKMI